MRQAHFLSNAGPLLVLLLACLTGTPPTGEEFGSVVRIFSRELDPAGDVRFACEPECRG